MNNYKNALYEYYKCESKRSFGPSPSLSSVIQSNAAMREMFKLHSGNTKFKKRYVRLDQ